MTGNSATDPLRVSAADTVAVSPDPQTTTPPAVIGARQSQPDTSAPAVASKKELKRADSTHPLNPTVPVPKEQNRDSVIIPALGRSGQPKFTGSTGAKPRQGLRTIAPLYAPGKGGDLASLRIRGTGDDTTSVRYIVDGEEHSDIAWLKADQIASIQIERGQEGKRMVIQTKAAAAGQEEEPFVALGGQPSFQGGDLVAFKRWVQERIRKPETALQNGIRNRVVASFVIDTMGRLCDIQVLLTPDQSLADEAVRVLKSSPLWEPGRQGDKKVPVKYTLPVDF
jgi:tonB family C-terminal domain